MFMKIQLTRRFGFLVNEVGRLYSHSFDRVAREKLGLSQAQCRVLVALASMEEQGPVTQAELAQKLGLTAMAVAGLADRMAAAGWIERRASASDRRANELHTMPAARKALERAMGIGDDLTDSALADLTHAERTQLVALLSKVRDRLQEDRG
jgi:DNA-binding MarR family transcriptional regulator